MDWLQTAILALIQGITEFLPISSSAHLIFPSQLLKWPDQGLAFDVAVHLGSLVAVCWYLRRDIVVLSSNWLCSISRREHDENQTRLAWLIVLATIPVVVAGYLLNDIVENHLRSTLVIATTTILFAALLAFADRWGRGEKSVFELTWKMVLVIGFAQAIALIPGTSRSGVTMTAALAVGLSRTEAARFSFLLSIPVILAAGTYQLLQLMEQVNPVDWHSLMLGTLLSGLAAYACMNIFMKLVDRIGFMPFVIYRFILGIVLLALLAV